MTLVWAHRGASFIAPENTLEAFKLAQEMGADGIELDVHLSADGEVVVAHDETVDRCSSGTGYIEEMTLRELKQLDFTNHKRGYRGCAIPTLEEVFAFVKATNMTVNVEIKYGKAPYEGIEAKCLGIAAAMGMSDRVYYSSFNHYSLLILKTIDKTARIAPLYNEALIEPWKYAKAINAQAIHPYYPTMATPGMMNALHESGILCNPWTVDGEKELAWMTQLGVNAVITNKPDLALKIRNTFA